MKVTFVSRHEGVERRFELQGNSAIIGRGREDLVVEIDLVWDARVSRPHARVWREGDELWIEDLQSKRGTVVDGVELRGRSTRLGPGTIVTVGDTQLTVEMEVPAKESKPDAFQATEAPVEIVPDSNAALNPADALVPAAKSTDLEQRLAQLCEIPILIAAEPRFDRRLQLVVDELVSLIPGAARGALLLTDPATDKLLLSASAPAGQAAVSLRLARRALETREAFIWHEADEPGVAHPSVLRHRIATGMYAPVRWGDEVLGVLCADHPDRAARFAPGDLALLRVVAQYAGMAVVRHRTAEALRRQSDFTNRLFGGRFPPRVREELMRHAMADSLTLGTRQSPVTVLISDIRGFTRLSEQLGPQRLSDLLNDYFPLLIEAIFRHGGSIDRFVGDAIFAVFGSPEPDANQEENAVRAALDMQAAARALSALRASRGAGTCEIGVGVDCGTVLHGFIGNAERMEFAVVGDAANYASRYCAGAGPGQILISSAVNARVWNLVEAEPVVIQTKHEGDVHAHLVRGLVER